MDKIYIYRTKKLDKLESSYLWHYDNNPAEIVKNIIYLNDVTLLNSPFEYLVSPKGKPLLISPSRRGTKMWLPPPNNSRLTKEVEKWIQKGCRPVKVEGKMGLTYSFSNDSVHRVNPIIEGYRDVINIRVKPTLFKAPRYFDKKWTTGFEKSGVVNQNPEHAWKKLV